MLMTFRRKKWTFRFKFWSALLISMVLLTGCEAQVKPESVQSAQTLVENENKTIEQPQVISGLQPNSQEEKFQPNFQSNSQSHNNSQSNFQSNTSRSQNKIAQSQNTPIGIPVLYYHSIERETGNELRVPPEEFDSHLKFLSQAGYQSITLHELHQYFYDGLKLPQKPFVLTFDDGYIDNYTNAFQIAEKYGFTGTVFMVTDWIDGTGYLSKEQLREMSKQGWQIEAHTVSHPKLNEITKEQLKSELLESKRVLEEILSYPVTYLAYPYGIYTEQIIQEAKEAGYLMGFTTERGWAKGNAPYRIQRVYCYANMGLDEFKRRLENPDY
jgi:peptidoglycan/xylan/chitin deacetylase (PgdA/CDA1 family)